MSRSVASRASNASSKMLEQLANRSQTKILKAEGVFNDEEMRIIWNSLGLYINRNLRMGRGVNVPRLGVFTFTPPEVRLKGVTNQSDRDRKPRTPVFLIQKQFVKGMNFKTAVFYHQQFGMGLRPYASIGTNGDVPITKMNVAQISSYASMSKDVTQTALNRIIKYLGQKLLQGSNLHFQIPCVGTLVSKGSLIAIRFNQQLHRDTRTILSRSVDQRKQKGIMNLTSQNLKKLSNFSEMSQNLSRKPNQFFQIDESAKRYLEQNLGLSMNNSGLRRTATNFGDSFGRSKLFDRTGSQLMKTSSGGFTTGKIKNFNRQYNFALKTVKQWVYKNSLSTQKSFKDFCHLAGANKDILLEDDVWIACRNISTQITEQQSQQLFRLLDYNKDGYVTQDDWKKNISFDSNKLLKEFVHQIKIKNYKITDVLKIMKLQGVKSVGVYSLKESLKLVFPSLSEDDALFLSRYICKGKTQVGLQNLIDVLNISSLSNQNINLDREWEQRFVGRIKKKMADNQIFQYDLLNRFSFYDNKATGYVDQTEFKNVLAEIGVGITLSELLKIVRLYPINSSNQINYQEFVNRLNLFDADSSQHTLSQTQFQPIIISLINSQTLPFKLPISTLELTSYLQSKSFRDYAQSVILPYVKKLDVNEDGFISVQDLKAYKEKYNRKQLPILEDFMINNLFTKLRQKVIKKKISFHDVFRKIDIFNNGFITKEEWSNNLDKIMAFNEVQKQNMFELMNRVRKIQMVDYKTFLSFINSQNIPKVDVYEKFDWVQEVMQKIKTWYKSSKLTLEDTFKIVDRDGDTYLDEKDLINFLLENIKVSAKEASVVRVQKLIKVLDTFKKGKLNFLDWKTFIQKDKVDWIQDAKQQIGIVISRNYPNLQEAFIDITQGDKKLLFNAFEKWIKANKVLSGFMINEDILKHLYSAIDTHKKGYILENDFFSAFNSYNWKVQHNKQYIEELKAKFKNIQEAFRCLVSYKQTEVLTEQNFYVSSRTILGNRFSKSDLVNIWASISSGKNQISFTQFDRKYGCEWNNQENIIQKNFPKDSWLYRDFSIIKGTQTRTAQFNYSETQKMQQQSVQLFENLKDMLATSAKTLQQAFLEVDTQRKGKITNLQFKKAFRVLKIALTSKQIDLLMNYCHFELQKLIDWKQFIKIVNLRDEKKKILQRLLPRIQHLSDLLHWFMVSPKDAFRKWNNPRSGYMQFEQFYKMLHNLYEQAAQSFPEFQLTKELYDYIDVRKDGQVDFQQFTQIFRNCSPPSLLMGTKPANEQQMMVKLMKLSEQGKPVRQQAVPLFKNSPAYEEFVNLIGRNRKYLQTEIQKVNKQALVPYEVVEKVVREFASSQKFKLEDNLIRNLLAFSMTGEKVDYRLMLNDLKKRSQQIVEHPRRNFF